MNAHGQASKNPVKAAFKLGILTRSLDSLLITRALVVQQVWEQPVTVTACDKNDKTCSFTFKYIDVIGNGTFGIVCRARDLSTNEVVAIKTVYQDEGHQVSSL